MITREQVQNAAREWLGAPYQHEGRDMNGLDCIGHVINVGKAVGAIPQEFDFKEYYGGHLWKHLDTFAEFTEEVSEIKAGYGFMLCHSLNNRRAKHAGFFTENGVCWLHSAVTIHRVTENPRDILFDQKIVKIWKFKGVID